MTSCASRSALRRLIRAKQRAFRNDAEMLAHGRRLIREQFEQHRRAPAAEIPALLRTADEAVEFLHANVVQAPLNERGNYVVDATTIDESKR